jgi:hypothetical protein
LIDPTDPQCAATILQLRRVVLRISLMSHAPTQSYDVVMKGDDVPNPPPRWRLRDTRPPTPHMGAHSGMSGDTAIPRGGIRIEDDKQAEFRQKSHVYFQRQLDRLLRAKRSVPSDLDALLDEAVQALEDWRKTPLLAGARPVMSDPRWKQWVADSEEDGGTLARWYGVTRQYIHQVRKAYREGSE